jgi:serine/threonine protein kinase
MNPPDDPSASTQGVGRDGWEAPGVAQIQEMLPQYEVSGVIGCGGMGAVYRARQRSLDRVVAVKVLPPQLREADATFAGRFKNEAQAMARLSHPGIVAVHDFGEAPGGQLYFVMELVEGTDLSEVLRQRTKLPPDEALSITLEICDALSYAHENGVVHRDIKPSNILLTRKGHVKVADFGLAKMDDSLIGGDAARTALTRTGTTVGTPEFVAPEALIMGAHVDGRADLYALGVMLYQMLTGEIPRGLFLMPGVQSRGAIDERFDHVISKAMQSNRDLRYQSATAMRLDLEAIKAGPANGPSQSAAAATPAVVPLESSVTDNPRKANRPLLVALVFAAIAVGAAVSNKLLLKLGDLPPTVPSNPPNPEPWTDGLEEWWRFPKGGNEGALAREPGGSRVLDVNKAVFMRNWQTTDIFTDVAFRARVRNISDYTSLYVRMSGAFETVKNYQAVLWRDGTSRIALNGTQAGGKELKRWPPPPGFVVEGPHTIELVAQGDRFTLFVDDYDVGTVQDGTLKEGKIYFKGDAGTLIESLEYRELGAGK